MFQHATFALLTQHGKERIIAPLLEQKLAAKLCHTQAFDTDQLGTFTGEVERELSPAECATKKALLASELTGHGIGLGSEGSFFSSPLGLGTVAEELIACISREQEWSIVGRYITPVDVRETRVEDLATLLQFVKQVPQGQGLVLRSNGYLAKGLHGEDEIQDTIHAWFGNENFEGMTVSYDLRAHQCPTRQDNIARAMENLIERLLSLCPTCRRPGFWPDKSVEGLECELCSAPTAVIKERIAECGQCHYQQVFPVEQQVAEARYCPVCNP